MNRAIELELITSLVTIILVILSIAIFIKYHAGVLFYLIIAVTLVFGFLNAWLISTIDDRSGRKVSRVERRTRRRKRR